MQRHIITILILALAIVFYAAGMSRPAGILVLLGMAAELVFWLRVLRRKPAQRDV